MSESGPPPAPEKTNAALSFVARPPPTSSRAWRDSGTRCGLRDFMRSAGTFHSPASKSISDHAAPRTSPERAAVRMANSRAPAALALGRANRHVMRAIGRRAGRRGRTFATLVGSASIMAMWPFQRAGLGPSRYSATMAQSSTFSMRLRRRVAVSAFAHQMGSRISSTCAVLTSWTGSAPIMGSA